MSCNTPAIRAVFDSATVQTLAAGATINLPEVTSNNCCLTSSGGTVNLRDKGNYEVNFNVTMVATAVGPQEVQLYRDGSPVPGAHAIVTAAAIGNLVAVSGSALVSVDCCNTTLSLRVPNATSVRIANMTVENIDG